METSANSNMANRPAQMPVSVWKRILYGLLGTVVCTILTMLLQLVLIAIPTHLAFVDREVKDGIAYAGLAWMFFGWIPNGIIYGVLLSIFYPRLEILKRNRHDYEFDVNRIPFLAAVGAGAGMAILMGIVPELVLQTSLPVVAVSWAAGRMTGRSIQKSLHLHEIASSHGGAAAAPATPSA